MDILAYILSLLTGACMTLQSGVNTQLKEKVGNPVLSALISFGVGFITLVIVYSLLTLNKNSKMFSISNIKNTPLWLFTGGILGAFVVFSNIFVAPKIGFCNMFSLIILGQIVLALVLDHFGVFGVKHAINLPRVIGIILLLTGVILIERN